MQINQILYKLVLILQKRKSDNKAANLDLTISCVKAGFTKMYEFDMN